MTLRCSLVLARTVAATMYELGATEPSGDEAVGRGGRTRPGGGGGGLSVGAAGGWQDDPGQRPDPRPVRARRGGAEPDLHPGAVLRAPGLAIAHFDLYRLRDASEAYEIGLDEALDDGRRVLIEWPERLGGHLPADRILDIQLNPAPTDAGEQRLARLTSHGAWEGRPIEF